MTTGLSIKLLGPPLLEVDNTPIQVDTRKAIALAGNEITQLSNLFARISALFTRAERPELAALVDTAPSSAHNARQHAQQSLETIKPRLSPAVYRSAVEHGRQRDLGRTREQLLLQGDLYV